MATITAAGTKHLTAQNWTTGAATLADTILAFVSSRRTSPPTAEEIQSIFSEFPKVDETIDALAKKGWLR